MSHEGRLLSDITPSPVLFLPGAMSVAEAAELMGKARTDAGLVESSDGRLVGILTDSDVSIKVAASGLSLRKTKVEEAMTANPLCVREQERADKALALMVEKRARHLPLLNASGGLCGMLDIAKVLYDAITRLEKTKDASENAYFPAMNRLVGVGGDGVPTLAEALAGRPGPATAAPGDAIEVAFAGLRRTRRSVLVLDEQGKLVGILSKSDVAKRALRTTLSVDEADESAALLRLRVRDVMTPRPDFIASTRSVLDALHKMHDGKYANLPVVDLDLDEPVGVVDVLDLLRASIGGHPHVQGPAKMPSILEGFFAAPKEAAPRLSDADGRPPPPRKASSDLGSAPEVDLLGSPTLADHHEPVPIATAVELPDLPRRASATLHCTISPSTLKYSKGIAAPVPAAVQYQLILSPSRRLTLPATASYRTLVDAALDHLHGMALDLHFDYSDALAKLRVVNDDTLKAATQLSLSLDPNATLVPLKVVVLKRKTTPLKLAANLLAVAAVAAAAAFLVARSPARVP